jgi:hypothetical protein
MEAFAFEEVVKARALHVYVRPPVRFMGLGLAAGRQLQQHAVDCDAVASSSFPWGFLGVLG